jgi:hypothetical protein
MPRPKTEALPRTPALYLLHLEAPVGGHAGHYLGEVRHIGARQQPVPDGKGFGRDPLGHPLTWRRKPKGTRAWRESGSAPEGV